MDEITKHLQEQVDILRGKKKFPCKVEGCDLDEFRSDIVSNIG
jgi:hypothetical protein